ncbi:MAG: hypothetical protein D6730_10680 [Bacteroidetes bacterium]|nr:MAG: hypothetical protein D6730_10680 [Bacteroidota bacterium]
MKPGIHIQKLQEYTGHTGSVFALTTDEAESTLFTSGDDGMVAAWDLKAGQDEGQGVLRIAETVYALCYIPSPELLLAGSSRGRLYVTDLKRKQLLHQLQLRGEAIYAMYHHPALQQLWVLQGKGHLSIFALPDFELRKSLRLSQQHLRSIVAAPDGQRLWIGKSDHEIAEVAAESGQVLRSWPAHASSVFALALHHDGKYLLSGGRDAHLKVWDLQQNMAQIRSIPAHHFTINAISFSPQGDHFLTASRDKTIKVWDAFSFELLKVVDKPRNEGHLHSVNRIKWLKDGSFVSCSDDRKVMRWRIQWR